MQEELLVRTSERDHWCNLANKFRQDIVKLEAQIKILKHENQEARLLIRRAFPYVQDKVLIGQHIKKYLENSEP